MLSPNILVVCTANICRSPIGMVLVQAKAREAGYSDWTFQSAGTWAEAGRAAAAPMIEIASEWGLDLTKHRSQPITESLLQQADLVLLMTRSQREGLLLDFPQYRDSCRLWSELRGARYDIEDPIGGPRQGYATCALSLKNTLEQGWERLLGWVQPPSPRLDTNLADGSFPV